MFNVHKTIYQYNMYKYNNLYISESVMYDSQLHFNLLNKIHGLYHSKHLFNLRDSAATLQKITPFHLHGRLHNILTRNCMLRLNRISKNFHKLHNLRVTKNLTTINQWTFNLLD